MGGVLVSSAVQMQITLQNEKTWAMACTSCLGHRRCLINRIKRLRLGGSHVLSSILTLSDLILTMDHDESTAWDTRKEKGYHGNDCFW
jgi:hypothetical protein